MTQEQAVRNHIINNGSITQAQAVRLYGCYRLSARIYDMRKDGYEIATQYKTSKNRFGYVSVYANYVLLKKGNYNIEKKLNKMGENKNA